MDGTSTNNLSVQKKRRGGNGGAGEQLTRAVGSKASDGPKEKGSHLNWRISGKASLHLS